MNYLLKSKPKRNFDIKIILIVVVFVVLSGLSYLFPSFFRSGSQILMKPVWILRDKTGNSFSFITNFFYFKSALVKENMDLKDEVASLRLNKIDYDFLLKQNDELRSQLGMINNSNIIVSNILSKPPQSPFDTMVIDSGSNSGIEVGDKVYISDSIIIGLVSSVTSDSAIVKLFSNGDEELETTLYRTGASFVIKGSGGANFQLEVPSDTDILWGDVFVYPGNKYSVLATVYYIDSNSQSSFKTIYMRIPGNVFQAKRVLVEK